MKDYTFNKLSIIFSLIFIISVVNIAQNKKAPPFVGKSYSVYNSVKKLFKEWFFIIFLKINLSGIGKYQTTMEKHDNYNERKINYKRHSKS